MCDKHCHFLFLVISYYNDSLVCFFKHDSLELTIDSWRLHTVYSIKCQREREMFYLTTHSTHFIYGYMASDMVTDHSDSEKRNPLPHIGYSYRLTSRVLLYAPSHRQDNTYHSLCYTSRGALAWTRNSSMGPPHEGLIRRPTAPWANALPLSYALLPSVIEFLIE